MANGVQGNQPLSIEAHPQSTPATPATTPPGTAVPNMHSYPGQGTYESSRSMYPSTGTQHSSYAQQPSSYIKHEMGPPSARGTGSVPEHLDQKSDLYAHAQGTEQAHHGPEEEADHEHDAEYPAGNQTSYDTTRPAYNYGSLHGDQSQIPSELNGSPHQSGSNRATPRHSSGSQAQWHSGYNTPPRASGFYNVTSDTRNAPANGSTSNDAYTSAALPAGYAPTQMNGLPSNKRMREDDDHDSRSDGHGDDVESLKRRKTLEGAPGSSTTYDRDGRPINRVKSTAAARTRR